MIQSGLIRHIPLSQIMAPAAACDGPYNEGYKSGKRRTRDFLFSDTEMHVLSQDTQWIAEAVHAYLEPSEGGPNDDALGEHRASLLKLLYSALGAGKETYESFFECEKSFVRMLDSLGTPLMVCNVAGTIVHQTPALDELFVRNLERDQIRGRMQEFARCLAVGFLETRMGCYLIRSFSVESRLVSRGDLVVVKLEHVDECGDLPPIQAIQSRFRLTRQQTRIALLLIERRSDKEIAEMLVISPHTVRRHIEEILDKLEIHSRRDVARRISEGA